MHFLIIGCGSIGQRHMNNLQAMGYDVTGCDPDLARINLIKRRFGIGVFDNLRQALSNDYDAALICVPTSLHLPLAIEVAKRGMHLFIEKPLSHSYERIDELQSIVRKKKVTVLVGCNTRFLPSLVLAQKFIKENRIGKILSARVECGFYLPYWHPHEDYRNSYSAKKHLGGGVIFDDIHEIDSLMWLLGEVQEVFCCKDTLSNLEINTEDIAEIILRFQSKTIAQIHLDYLQKTYRRQYMFIGEKGDIIWDYIGQEVRLYLKKTNQWQVFQESINTKREVMFLNEMEHFINCIQGKERSVNDLDFSKKILKVALACLKSAERRKVITV